MEKVLFFIKKGFFVTKECLLEAKSPVGRGNLPFLTVAEHAHFRTGSRSF
jgi:hypothetical protein